MSRDPAIVRRTALARWGGVTARRPLAIALAWGLLTVSAVLVALAGIGGQEPLFQRLTSGEPTVPGEARTARDLIATHEPEQGSVLLMIDGVDLRSPQVAQAAGTAARDIMGIAGVASAANPFVFPQGPADPQARAFLSDGSIDSGGFVMVTSFKAHLSEAEEARSETQVRAAYQRLAQQLPGARASTGSGSALVEEIMDQVEVDLRAGEGIALPLSFILMVFVFGGFVAAGMPILGAIAAIGGALAALYGFTYVIDLDASVVNVVTLLGLALSIDYGLLIVSRVREELRAIARGRPAKELTKADIETAVSRTVATAGRTVFFSGITVAISLAGLMVFDAQIMRAIGAAGMSVVLIAMLAGLSLVPAACAVSAHRLLARGTETSPDEGVFSRLARWVHRAPWIVFPAAIGLLLVLALPTLSMRVTSSGHQLMPVGSSQRDFFDRLEQDYPFLGAPAATVVTRTSVAEATTWAQDKVAKLPGVTSTSVRPLDAEYVLVSARVAGTPLSDEARTLVTALRDQRPAFPTWVSGQAAALADFNASIARRAPLAIALVVAATMLLLFLMTGSVVIPIKALILNVLSLGASLGVATWIFQNGHFEQQLGFTSTGAVEVMIPPLVLAFGFGLSMDYELFLISRIAEIYHSGVENNRAVELGLQRSGRIITSAAALVVIVFAGFVAGKMLIIKQTGTALTVAILLDATIVRMLLVPATMELLGDWNWWAPGPLRRWHARHGITE